MSHAVEMLREHVRPSTCGLDAANTINYTFTDRRRPVPYQDVLPSRGRQGEGQMSLEFFLLVALIIYTIACGVWIRRQYPELQFLERWWHKFSTLARLLRLKRRA
jgi:hypothetical protein